MKDGTWFVGYGARTAVGTTAESSAAAVRANISMFGEHPFMIDKAGSRMIVARDAFLSEDIFGVDRFVQLGLSAARQALVSLRGRTERPRSAGLLIGLPPDRPGLPKGLPEHLTDAFRTAFRSLLHFGVAEFISTGHSGGLMAIEEACKRVGSGAMDACLVGGIDSYLEPETLEWIDGADRLHSRSNSFGFIPGEGAGFCFICTTESLRRLGLKQAGKVLSVATAREMKLINTGAVCLGEGLTSAIRGVLDALPSSSKIDHMICDLNGEPYRADELGYTLVRTSDRFTNANDFQTPAECWGDVGAASGPLFVTLALVAGAKGYAKGPHTLAWTSSDAGERSAILFQSSRRGEET